MDVDLRVLVDAKDMSVLVAEQVLAALVDLRATSAVRRIDLGREDSQVFLEEYSVAHKDSSSGLSGACGPAMMPIVV
jgi:hypothetical protein